MASYIDISVPTSPDVTTFPGDPAPKFYWPGWTHENGDPANVGFFDGGLHHGTHVDAPWHFIRDAKRLEEIPLDHWVGPCCVVDMTGCEKCVDEDALNAADLPDHVERLLLKTRNSNSEYWHEPWNPEFIYIHESAARWCVQHGIKTVGLDYLTIDPPSEPKFPAHLELLGHEVTIIENVVLRDVEPGEYELLAAPVKVQQVDGGWCRALLRRD